MHFLTLRANTSAKCNGSPSGSKSSDVRGASFPQCTLKGTPSRWRIRGLRFARSEASLDVRILTWLLGMLCKLGVAIYERESAGAMVFQLRTALS